MYVGTTFPFPVERSIPVMTCRCAKKVLGILGLSLEKDGILIDNHSWHTRCIHQLSSIRYNPELEYL